MGQPESPSKGNPWPALSVATAFALRVAAALVVREPALGVAAQPVGRDELLRVVDPETKNSIGFDAHLGLTDCRGDQVFGWEWILGLEPEDVAGEILTHWLRSESVGAHGDVSEVAGSAETVLSVLAHIATLNGWDAPGGRHLTIEGAALYNARGGTPDVDALLEEELADHKDARSGVTESLWFVWSGEMFVAGLGVDGRLITPRDGRAVIGEIRPGRAGAVAAASRILDSEVELRHAYRVTPTSEEPTDMVSIQRSLAVRADDIWKAVVHEGHLWGMQHDDVAVGIDFAGAAVGSDVISPDGRAGQVTDAGAHHLGWTWRNRGNTEDDESVQLRLDECAGATEVTVVTRAARKSAHDVTLFWEQWLDALDDWLTFPTRSAGARSSGRPRTDALWSPHDPQLSELEAATALRRREHDPLPDMLEGVALRALLARALAVQGKLDEAEKVIDDAFSGFKEAPAWVPMLEALERGRIDKERAGHAGQADELLDVDDLWTDAAEHLARCVWIAPGADVDLLLEAAWELASMTTTADGPGYTSLWAEFGRAVAARASAEVRDTWSPRFAAL